jgi:hypothetical protein
MSAWLRWLGQARLHLTGDAMESFIGEILMVIGFVVIGGVVAALFYATALFIDRE